MSEITPEQTADMLRRPELYDAALDEPPLMASFTAGVGAGRSLRLIPDSDLPMPGKQDAIRTFSEDTGPTTVTCEQEANGDVSISIDDRLRWELAQATAQALLRGLTAVLD